MITVGSRTIRMGNRHIYIIRIKVTWTIFSFQEVWRFQLLSYFKMIKDASHDTLIHSGLTLVLSSFIIST